MTRTFGKYIFSKAASLKPDCELNGEIAEFMPQSKYKHKEHSSLHKYGRGPFCRFRITTDLPFQGVYMLTENGNIAYIGEYEDLSARINMGYGQISPRNCYEGGQRTNCKINTLIFRAAQGGNEIDLWFLRTDNRKSIERELIDQFKPHWNGNGRFDESAHLS